MPIMDGYEACTLIHKYISEKQDQSSKNKKILIYALTADVSDQTMIQIKKHPFVKTFDCIRNENEVKLIQQEILQNKVSKGIVAIEAIIQEEIKEEESFEDESEISESDVSESRYIKAKADDFGKNHFKHKPSIFADLNDMKDASFKSFGL